MNVVPSQVLASKALAKIKILTSFVNEEVIQHMMWVHVALMIQKDDMNHHNWQFAKQDDVLWLLYKEIVCCGVEARVTVNNIFIRLVYPLSDFQIAEIIPHIEA